MLNFTVEVRRLPHSQVLRIYNTSPARKCPSLSAITYSDMDFSLTSRSRSTKHLGMGTSLRAALVFSVVETTGLLCSVRHALLTEIYGAGASRNTQSH